MKMSDRVTPQTLFPQEKIPRYPLDKIVGGLQDPSGRGGEEKKFPALVGNRPSVFQPVYHSLCLLCFPGSAICWQPLKAISIVGM